MHNEARAAGSATPGNGQTSDKWSSQEYRPLHLKRDYEGYYSYSTFPFIAFVNCHNRVMETFVMKEADLTEYCRSKGLYREQIEAWKEVCLQANGQAFDQVKQLNGQLKEEQQRAKVLEKEKRFTEERKGISGYLQHNLSRS